MTLLRSLTVAVVLVAVPAATFADNATTIVRPLREIGHVRATSSFCTTFAQGGGPAASAALAFENRLYITGNDLRSFDSSSPLGAHRSGRLLEDDLHALADDALAGRAELAALREKAIASGTPSGQAVVDFADALSGAQGRQMDIARRIARIVGTLEEAEFSTIVNSPLDAHYANAFSRSPGQSNALLDDPIPGSESVYANNFFSTPGDDLVGHDLAHAVERAHDAMAAEKCL